MGCLSSSYDEAKLNCLHFHEENYRNLSCVANVGISDFAVSGKILGIGGFGLVRLAKKKSGLDKDFCYALKSLSKSSILQRPSGISTVMNELNILTSFGNEPFICNVKYAFQDLSLIYLVLDFAIGGDMRYNIRKMKNRRFCESSAMFYICQVLIAIEVCHQAKILHRDVKPENILMCSNGFVKLSDFGIAKMLPNIEDCYSTSGTHGYMAPEVYVNDHRHGRAVDWFAVGVTLHEFVMGKRPFEQARLRSFRDVSNHDSLSLEFPAASSWVGSSCKDFITSLVAAKPENRLGSKSGLAEIKKHPWLAGVDWEGIQSQSCSPPLKPSPRKIPWADTSDGVARAVIKSHLHARPVNPSYQHMFDRYVYPLADRDSCRTASGGDSITGDLFPGTGGAERSHLLGEAGCGRPAPGERLLAGLRKLRCEDGSDLRVAISPAVWRRRGRSPAAEQAHGWAEHLRSSASLPGTAD